MNRQTFSLNLDSINLNFINGNNTSSNIFNNISNSRSNQNFNINNNIFSNN